ncbi:MAG: threonine synthase, partial [Lachnospiraceae bacterium]|nr:threonine synthase [Lachnospiraceae bacterium]
EILEAMKLLGSYGIFGEPAGVAGSAGLKKACETGLIPKGSTVVSVVTGNGLKDTANAIKAAGEPMKLEPKLDLLIDAFKKIGKPLE